HQEALQAKQKAAAEAKEKAAEEAKQQQALEAKQKAAEAAANKRAESRRIASSAKHDFQQKIYHVWDVPTGSKGKTASVRVTLNDSGGVTSVLVNSSDPDVQASVEAAIRQAAPYPMPSDPDARRDARSFSATFTAK
ncbi:protein TolA, partial [Acinetobacter nectaris CIP 110549]